MTDKFVMVPREPTEAMLSAMHNAEAAPDGYSAVYGPIISCNAIYTAQYRAALSAAPPAPQGESAHGASDCNEERTIRETLVPCDCGCGRSCCAGCGADLGYLKAPPAIAAGPVVTDEMVERAFKVMRDTPLAADARPMIRAALTAALWPQP